MEKIKVLFISQEITPYLPESEMSLIGRNLPQGIQERGKEIRTFMPKFGCINERRNQLHEVIRLSGMNLIIDDADHPLIIKVASIQAARMQVYFIDNEDYFHRKALFCDESGNYFEDNDERAIFFARGVIETVKKLQWAPDIVHCHGWMSALAPLYIKKALCDDPLFCDAKIIYSLYNENYPETLNDSLCRKVLMEGVSEKDIALLKDPCCTNLSKLAIKYADGIILASNDINPAIREYIAKADKPSLNCQDPDAYIDAYNAFYEEVLEESLVET